MMKTQLDKYGSDQLDPSEPVKSKGLLMNLADEEEASEVIWNVFDCQFPISKAFLNLQTPRFVSGYSFQTKNNSCNDLKKWDIFIKSPS